MKKIVFTFGTECALSELFGVSPSYHPDLSDQALKALLEDHEPCDGSGEMNAFYGLKHTQESKELMSQRAKARPSNRKGATLSPETRKLVSLNNASAKSIQTPFGTFRSKVEAAEKLNTTTESLRVILNKKIDLPVTRKSVLFSKECVGKTPRELGWAYV